MTHTLKFDASIKRDARDALKLMMSLFEANWGHVDSSVADRATLYSAPAMVVYPPAPISPADVIEMVKTSQPFEYVYGDCCIDPFTALATFFTKLAAYGLTKKLGADLLYRVKPEVSWEMSFLDDQERYKVGARLVLIGEDNLPAGAND